MACRYAGIDWALDKHDVLVADQNGVELLAATYVHDEKDLTALCRALVRLEVGLVAIERPDGLLVERLLDAGLRALALHPNKVAAARDRFQAAHEQSLFDLDAKYTDVVSVKQVLEYLGALAVDARTS